MRTVISLLMAGLCWPLWVAGQTVARTAPSTATAGEVLFTGQVRKILSEACIRCHNADQKKGGLDLSRRAPALLEGESGAVIAPGSADESLLVEKVKAGEMPPKNQLTPPQVEAIRSWIADGAPYQVEPVTPPRAGPDWWSLQPIRQLPVPAVAGPDSRWVRTPIGAFILAKLGEKNLRPAPEADHAAWIRRLSSDLVGLPPEPEAVSAFVNDPDPLAYEKLVVRLLASPHHGERWGRHWLDVVCFGESEGYETNMPRPNAWPYCDYVIASFNRDTPFPRFVLEQLAGDTLADASWLTQAATGFLVGGTHDNVGNQTVEGMCQQRVEVAPSGIAAVRPPLALPASAPERQRRTALARWLGDPANTLPARVMVNRVWHYHFGQGIVATPGDFGYNGSPPSHPELLDWLASRYIAEGWQLKPLHRLIVLSATYRQSSRLDAGAQSIDRQNRLLWRMPPRRLEAESIRDAILACGGRLDQAMGGPGYNIWEKNTNYVAVYQPPGASLAPTRSAGWSTSSSRGASMIPPLVSSIAPIQRSLSHGATRRRRPSRP
jgi:mono/diheme cytochrome c family protein